MRIGTLLYYHQVGTRLQIQHLIEQGDIQVAGLPAQLNTVVTGQETIQVKGQTLNLSIKPIYLILNKPVGYETVVDIHNSHSVMQLLPQGLDVFPVGRLDKGSEGLLLFTNNGDVVNEVLRSEKKQEKEYLVRLNKPIAPSLVQALETGMHLGDEVTLPAKVKLLGPKTMSLTLTQGLNRQIRRMVGAMGYQVQMLKRHRFMNLTINGLPVGQFRYLHPHEVHTFFGMLPPPPFKA